MQVEVDAIIEAVAAAGPTARESTAAMLRHQPTPGSIAAAEEEIGDGPKMEEAVAALAKAREADAAERQERLRTGARGRAPRDQPVTIAAQKQQPAVSSFREW